MSSYKKVLLLGSGGLRIGQAGEFDYSGSQAIKALKEEGIEVILINPNIATIQTDVGMADRLYLQPLNVETVEKILAKERPDGILLSFGGQTALNLGLKLEEEGILEKYGVTVLGTPVSSIRKGEDRDLFKAELKKIGVDTPKSIAVHSVEEALKAAEEMGYPLMLRSGFSLGGLGSGKIETPSELKTRALSALQSAGQILIEEYLVGWKELEYEVVRDGNDQALTICNMENFDPMGVHTGESIVVAPSQTLNNYEYHLLRDVSIKIARHLGIQGECNVQFALDPKTSAYRVIEMNPRLSRSSALASKATGYPLAFVAAKIALGFALHEIPNAITKKTSAFFEPALDYVVVKMPRWDLQKFKSAQRTIGTEMKSVGEIMAIGRTFKEALQKGIRMLNIGSSDLSFFPPTIGSNPLQNWFTPTDHRIFSLYHHFQTAGSIEEAHKATHIDRWFLAELKAIWEIEKACKENPLSKELVQKAKQSGFSDRALAQFFSSEEEKIRTYRKEQGIVPFIKQIDTSAGEVDAETNYLYTTYQACSHDITPTKTSPLMVLGSGPYCIGSSVEFDWCAVNMCRALRAKKKTVILINSNPETVSTDFDESDRLYFEELTEERIRDLCDFEEVEGVVLSVGGQIANNLAYSLEEKGYPLLGTSAKQIDRAENRDTFSSLLNTLEIDQPAWQKATSLENAKAFARQVGYPVLIRPSYVLSGAAMNVIFEEKELEAYLSSATVLSPKHPVVLSKFVENAKELEIDGVADQGKIVVSAISEHVENAGVHSGDATLVLPPQRIYLETIRQAKKIARQIAKELQITGPFNLQFLAKGNQLQVIECNLRAARSFPFVSKVTKVNFIQIVAEILLKTFDKTQIFETLELDYVGVKTPQFSYQRLTGADPVASVEMASTGEVAHIGENYHSAFFASWLSTEQKVQGKRLFISAHEHYRTKLLAPLKELEGQGWDFFATEGTHAFLARNGIGSISIYKIHEPYTPNVSDLLKGQKVDLIINLPIVGEKNHDEFLIRRLAIDHHIPLITNLQLADIFLQCLSKQQIKEFPVLSWQDL